MNALSYALRLDNSAFLGGLSGARGALGKLEGGLGSVLGAGAKLAGLGAGIAGVGAGAAAFKAFDLAKNFEQTTVAFRTMVGDAGKADALLGSLKKLGADTPFEFPELADAGRKLLAFGEGADSIPGTLSRIGDVAAGIQAPIGEIAEIYGKARTQGTLFAEDINQLTGRGIPVIQEFARTLGVSEGEVKKLAAEGAITFPMLEQAFGNLTSEGGKFHNMMAAQSKTTAGLMSTLGDAWNDVLLAVGTPVTDGLKPVLESTIQLAGRIPPVVAAGVALIQGAVANGSMGDIVAESLQFGFMQGTNYGVGALAYLGTATMKTFEFGFMQSVRLFSGGMNEALGNMGEGLLMVMAGFGKMVTSKMGAPFLEIAANFEAALTKGIEEVLALIGRVPVLGEKLGLDDLGRQGARSFAEIRQAALEAYAPKSLENDGAALMRKGLEKAGAGATQIWESAKQDASAAFDGLEFKPVEIFDQAAIDASAGKVRALTEAADPDAWKQLQASLENLTRPLDAAKDAGADAGKAMATAMQGANAAADKLREKMADVVGKMERTARFLGRPDKQAIDERSSQLQKEGIGKKDADRIARDEAALEAANASESGTRRNQLRMARDQRRAEREGRRLARSMNARENADEGNAPAAPGRDISPGGMAERIDRNAAGLRRDISPGNMAERIDRAAAGLGTGDLAGRVDRAGRGGVAGATRPARDSGADKSTATLDKILAELTGLAKGLQNLVAV